MMIQNRLQGAAKSVFFGAVLVVALALNACENDPPVEPEKPHYTSDGRRLVNIQISMGDERTARSLSPEVAETWFNYFEVVFADTANAAIPGNVNDPKTVFYRAAGYTGLPVKLTVPEGLYDNQSGNNKAVMMAGKRDMETGECILLATGVIVSRENGTASLPTAQIEVGTTRVIFSLHALTANITNAPDSAFGMDAVNYGTTTIGLNEYPFFRVAPGTRNGPVTTLANYTISGWENSSTGNNTQQFMYLLNKLTDEFGLTGIGAHTVEGDDPLASGSVTWKITNTGGTMTTGDPIHIEFTSYSQTPGMGWLPVLVPARVFTDKSGAQLWYIGSGVDYRLNAGANSPGAAIIILNGNTTPSQLTYILDLDATRNPNPVSSATGVWTWDGVTNTFTLLGHTNATVRVIGNTTTRRIKVATNADAKVLLENVSMSSSSGSPFTLEAGAKATLYLADGTTNVLQTTAAGFAGLKASFGTTLIIEKSGTAGAGRLEVQGGQYGAGIGGGDGGSAGEAGGTITINGGVVVAAGGAGGAGIGGGSNSTGAGGDSGTIRITNGTVLATGGTNGAGIGGGGGLSGGKGETITISGGLVIAQGYGAGIGGGAGVTTGGNGGSITVSGGTVIAQGGVSSNYGSAGIGGGAGATTGGTGGSVNIEISGGVVIAEGGDGSSGKGAGIGAGSGSTGGNNGIITFRGGTVYAKADSTANGIGLSNSGGSVGTISIAASTYPVIFTTSANTGINSTPVDGIFVGTDVDLTNLISSIVPATIAYTGTVVLAATSGTIPGGSPAGELIVPAGMTFNLKPSSGITLTNNGTVVNNGTIRVNAGNTLTNSGTWIGNAVQ